MLSHLGFSFQRARGRHITAWDTSDGITLDNIGGLNLEDAESRYGAPLMSVHRVDLHREFWRLALSDDVASGAPKVTIRLNSKAVGANADDGTVEVAGGAVFRADLIVTADCVHSVLRSVVLGSET